MILTRRYELEAAHQLSAGVPEGHQCRRLHGHCYKVEIQIHGDVAESTGMVMEYAEIDAVVQPVLDLVDHRFTNMLGFDFRLVVDQKSNDPYQTHCIGLGFEFRAPQLAQKVRDNSTVEHLAAWMYAEIRERLKSSRQVGFLKPHLVRLRIQEDSRSYVEIDHA